MTLRKRKLTNHIVSGALLLLTSAFASSCVHEWPDENCEVSYQLNLEFETGWSLMDYEYTRSGEQPASMTYTIHAYPMTDGEINRGDYREFEFTRDVNGDYDCQTTLSLEPGNYRVMVWADFKVDGGYYYDSSNFNGIEVKTDPYTGNTDMRDAFAGSVDITVAEMGGLENNATVKMQRPLGKYEFIATNADDFLARQSETNGREMTLQDYYLVFRYPDYVPTQFNMFNRRGSDAKAGLMYNSYMSALGNGEASLGFDYVFANEEGTYVTVYGNVYAKADGRLVASTPQVRVPLRPSYITILRGEFLDVKRNEGVGIDPGYEGEFNVPGNLTPSN